MFQLNQTKLELDFDQFGWFNNWKANRWDFQVCVMPDSMLDNALKSYGYPAWTAFNCEQFLRLQNVRNCSAAMTLGNQLNESIHNFTGEYFNIPNLQIIEVSA